MSYIDSDLLPDERILFRTGKNPIVFFVPVVWTCAAAVFYFATDLPFLIAGVFGLISIGFWLSGGFDYFTSEYAVTNMRVMMKEGFFLRHVNETLLPTIAGVTVEQSLAGRFLNYGTVTIHSFGGGADPFVYVTHPVAFQRRLQQEMLRPA